MVDSLAQINSQKFFKKKQNKRNKTQQLGKIPPLLEGACPALTDHLHVLIVDQPGDGTPWEEFGPREAYLLQ